MFLISHAWTWNIWGCRFSRLELPGSAILAKKTVSSGFYLRLLAKKMLAATKIASCIYSDFRQFYRKQFNIFQKMANQREISWNIA